MILEKAVELYPEALAIVEGARRMTYREVQGRVRRLAKALCDLGVGRGDRIAALDRNSLEMFELYYAASATGAIFVPLNVRAASGELGAVLADCSPKVLFARDELMELATTAVVSGGQGAASTRLFAIGDAGSSWGQGAMAYEELLRGPSELEPVALRGEEVAHLYYTSGTTGRPKGVMLTHRNVCVHALAAMCELSLRDTDVWAHVAPMFHLADAWATFAITWVGGVHVMVPRFEPRAVLHAFETHGVTVTNLVPTMLNLMVKHPDAKLFDYRTLRLLLSGGAPIAPEVVRAIIEVFGCEYAQTYGMTETSPYLTVSLPKRHMREWSQSQQLRVRAKTGRPLLAVTLEVVDEEGRHVPRDGKTVGEIRVRGETVTPGYWNLEGETAAAFRDGWLMTGDLAVMDTEGYLDIVDRKKDMILTGGENVYSTEVEHALYEHPAVLEAAVFGVPDQKWGEAVRAAVVTRPGCDCTEAELVEFLRSRLSAYKVPRCVDFHESLPRTGPGKIQKRTLRESYQERSLQKAAQGSSSTNSFSASLPSDKTSQRE
ncbi:MAG: long-chain-fatty-acid--CoA ligase [Myxococcota bacterium]|jgi:acyl-CoA synthetase (AMP-forming)/AMP-acid ligase II|nr:long-chain-fatty-acid--CoA ligase [Myxococcota bacterium]